MTTELGTELGTILGTILGSMDTTGAPAFDASKSYALGGFSLVDHYATQAAGGEAGDAAGFGGASLIALTSLPASGGTSGVQAKYATTPAGWWNRVINTGTPSIRTAMMGTAPPAVDSPARVLNGSDIGRVILAVWQHTGAGNLLRLYSDDGSEIGNGTAITGYTPAAVAQQIGSQVAGFAFLYGHVLSGLHWRGVPSAAQIRALFTATRTLGDIPGKAAIEALSSSRAQYATSGDGVRAPVLRGANILSRRKPRDVDQPRHRGRKGDVSRAQWLLLRRDARREWPASFALTGTQWLDASLSRSVFRPSTPASTHSW